MKVMVLSLYWLVIYEASWKSIWKELVRFDGVCCWFWWQIHFSGAMNRILVPYFVVNLLPFYIKNLLYYFLVDETRMYSKYTPDNFASHYSSKFNYFGTRDLYWWKIGFWDCLQQITIFTTTEANKIVQQISNYVCC